MRSKYIFVMFMVILSLVAVGCAPTEEMQDEPMQTSEMAEESTEMESEEMDEADDSEMMEDDSESDMMEESSASMESMDEMPEMTLEELAMYNGKDGQPIYVAVDGIIYDFTPLEKWAGGEHMGQHEAGQDLSEEILSSPHGKAILERATPVAKLVKPMEESMEPMDEMLELTLEELAKYNGKDGQPAYVAVDGIIYDFTPLAKWAGGEHMGQHEAGQDLSKEILQSPHGKAILERATPVGKLIN